MDSIGALAHLRLNQHKLGQSTQASLVLFHAQKWLAERFEEDPRAVRPVKLQQGVLWLQVTGSVWLQEVHGAAGPLLLSLQSRYGKNLVKAIRVKSI